MPTFDTPEPISVSIELLAGNVTLVAEDRTDTEVTVAPSNPDDESDVQMAEQTRVDFANGTLTIKGRSLRDYVSWANKSRSVAVTVALPTGSRLSGAASIANVNATGRLGDCEFKAGVGHFLLGQTGSARLRTLGDISVEQVEGDADLSTGSGKLRLGRVSGTATLKNSNGDSWIGAAGGVIKARASNGDINIDRATADVEAVSSNGTIRLARVDQGTVELKTSMGGVEIGVPEGTAAWVDAKTGYGKVRNLLDSSVEPQPGVPVAKIQARSSYGDITIRRP